MSITKGAMLISNANAVGTELVNQLGGTGYKPVEWSDKINLLGINSVDAPYAIKSIQAGTYTGEERGAIQYSNCNAVGSMLNKKFSTDRGFKPVEWESAISKLTPLAERTVSGSVVSIENGADDVPTKSLVVTIPPTLTGVSSVSVTQTGRNLVALNVSPQQAKRDFGITLNTQTADTLNITTTGVAYACERLFYSFKKGTYAVKFLATSSDSYIPTISIYRTNGTGVKFSIQPNTLTTFTLSEDANIDIRLFASGSGDTTIRTVEYTNLQIEVGSTVSTYSQYNSTQYTASLCRTIYGGTADIVNGHGKITHGLYTFTGNEVYVQQTNQVAVKVSFTVGSSYQTGLDTAMSAVEDFVAVGCGASNYLYVKTTKTAEDLKTYMANHTVLFVYVLATQTDFTFTGQEVPTRLGYNAFWSDDGDTEVTYYQAPTALTRSTVSGSIASFSDADTRLTCVNAIATIPPSIAGVDTVQLVDVGETIFYPMDVEQGSISGSGYNSDSTTRIRTAERKAVTPSTQYKIKVNSEVQIYEVHEYTDLLGSATHLTVNASEYTFTTKSTTNYLRILFRYSNNATITPSAITELQVTNDVLYWKTYTANLPSTNYGGSVNFVNGDVENTNAKITDFSTLRENGISSTGAYRYIIDVSGMGDYNVGACISTDLLTYRVSYNANVGEFYNTTNVLIIFLAQDNAQDAITYLQSNLCEIVYPLATPTTASITGQAIIPKTGTNNCYNNVGGNTEITYFTNT